MNFVITLLTKIGVLKDDLDYRFVRTTMVIVFLFDRERQQEIREDQ